MKIDLSIATTSYNSSSFIHLLVQKIEEECVKLTQNYEIVIVDDHSPDNSWSKISEICKSNPRVKSVRLARNYGQQIASSIALEKSQGENVILMDGDFENPLTLFKEILEGLKEGNEIVYVTSTSRQSVIRKVTSSFFWIFCTRILRLRIVPNQLMLRGMNRDYVNSFLEYKDFIRNVAIINFDMGGKYKELNTQIGERAQGSKSNSGFFKRLDQFFNLIILISNKPLTWVFFLGLFSFLGSCLFLIYSVFLYFRQSILPGYTSLIASIFMFGGLNLLVLSLVGRYLSNVYTEVRKRPLYRQMEELNF